MIDLFGQAYYEDSRLDSYFFPVERHEIYFAKKPIKEKPVGSDVVYAKNFIGIVDEERSNMLACVSPSYTLIRNEWAYNKEIEAAISIFKVPEGKTSFMGGLLNENRSACEMDVRADKEIQIKQCKHRWIGYVHMENSYDRTTSLCYNVGFYMETMDNREIPLGLLLPSLSLDFKISHSWMLKTIEKKIDQAIRQASRDVFAEFQGMIDHLLNIEVVDDEILPLFCRLAKIKDLKMDDEDDWKLAKKVISISKSSEEWINKCGPNAYAAMCAFADFASQYARDKDIAFFKQPSVFKSQMGAFVEDLLEAKRKQGNSFSLDEFIGKDAREAKKKIKILCSNPCPLKVKGEGN